MTDPRPVGGWNEVEIILVRCGDGSPISGRMLLWLYKAAGLVWGPKRETVAVVAEAEHRESRDIVFEGLVDLAGTMRLAGNFAAHLILEAMVAAHERGTMGELARAFEEIRPAMPYDHPAIEASVARRMALVSEGVPS